MLYKFMHVTFIVERPHYMQIQSFSRTCVDKRFAWIFSCFKTLCCLRLEADMCSGTGSDTGVALNADIGSETGSETASDSLLNIL